MSRKLESTFSTGLKCLSLQMESLFEECGGEHAVRLLDLLAQVPADRQRALLAVFSRVARDSADQPSGEEQRDDPMEEELYRDILRELRTAHFAPPKSSEQRKVSMLTLMEGGKAKEGDSTGRDVSPRPSRIDGVVT